LITEHSSLSFVVGRNRNAVSDGVYEGCKWIIFLIKGGDAVKNKLTRFLKLAILFIHTLIKALHGFVDDLLFIIGAIFLSLGGLLLFIPIGFFILGVCCMAYAFIVAKSKADRGGG